MLKVLCRAAALATFVSLPLGASALDFTVTEFTSGALVASQTEYTAIKTANFASVFATEDFEGFMTVGQIGPNASAVLTSAVGKFTTLGGTGDGTTAIDDLNAKGTNRGKNIAIRQDDDTHPNGGRQNTSFKTADDKTYLDSNDTWGFKWVAAVADGKLFDRLLFTLTDPTDQGQTLTISAEGHTEKFTMLPRKPDGQIFNILIGFSKAVSSATLTLAKSDINDGFSIDNITVGAVPLPAAAWLLLGVSGALVAAKRRSSLRAA